jgi:GNAT superfamily N-acetyltransferase
MYKVRDAIPTNSEQVCNVLRRSILEVCAPEYDDESVINDWLSNKTQENTLKWIESNNAYSVVCTSSENKVVGFGLITLDGEILLFYLVPEALYQGNGKLMLERMEKRIISEGVNEIRTTSSITAKSFYIKNGFVENGPPRLVGNIEGNFPLIKKVTA